MPSHIEQARRQGEFLRTYLESEREALLEKFLGPQGSFQRLPIDVLVAISDEGVIRRPQGQALPEVLKADQVPARVQELLREYRLIDGIWNLNLRESGYEFRQPELERIQAFLLEQHRPYRHSAVLPGKETALPPRAALTGAAPAGEAPAASAATRTSDLSAASVALTSGSPSDSLGTVVPSCPDCGGTDRRIEYGRYGYYWKCGACSGTATVRYHCEQCGSRGKIRKAGPQFSAECSVCQLSRSYFTNPS